VCAVAVVDISIFLSGEKKAKLMNIFFTLHETKLTKRNKVCSFFFSFLDYFKKRKKQSSHQLGKTNKQATYHCSQKGKKTVFIKTLFFFFLSFFDCVCVRIRFNQK